MRSGVFWGVLEYPGVSWGNQTDPKSQFKLDFTEEKKYHLGECSEYISLNVSGICHGLRTSRT